MEYESEYSNNNEEESERELDTDTPGAEGKGRSEGIEPPWKSFSVIVAFFFAIPLFLIWRESDVCVGVTSK